MSSSLVVYATTDTEAREVLMALRAVTGNMDLEYAIFEPAKGNLKARGDMTLAANGAVFKWEGLNQPNVTVEQPKEKFVPHDEDCPGPVEGMKCLGTGTFFKSNHLLQRCDPCRAMRLGLNLLESQKKADAKPKGRPAGKKA